MPAVPGAVPTHAEVLEHLDNEHSAVDIHNVKLSLRELMEMGNNVELPGEVEDLYHTSPPDLTMDVKEVHPQKVVNSEESTPTKRVTALTSLTTPRRSPRGHSVVGLNFIVIKFSINDLSGVDPRLDIPKVLILAQGESSKCQSVSELRQCLEDTSDIRMKHQFDLCMPFFVSVIFLSLFFAFSQTPAHPVVSN